MTPRTALVLGGSSGIGAAVAGACRDGHDVAVGHMAGEDRAAALVQQVADAGRTGIAVRADVRTEEGVVAAVEAAERELGGLAAVVHSVGAWGCQWRRGAGRRVTGSVLDATGGLR